MRTWRPTHTLLAGLALILLTNAVVALGVMWNRTGEPESSLVLSQRELDPPYRMRRDENSGRSFTLRWRTASASGGEYRGGYQYYGGSPEWLTVERMRELGFRMDTPMPDAAATQRRNRKELPREVLLVLELAGPTWQAEVERARDDAQKHTAAAAANPKAKEFAARAKNAQEELEREQKVFSRLFVIDAGLDAQTLRARYPDRAQLMIVRGTVRALAYSLKDQPKPAGYISELSVNEVHVAQDLIRGLANAEAVFSEREYRKKSAAFSARLNIGQRFEPWLVSLQAANGEAVPGVR